MENQHILQGVFSSRTKLQQNLEELDAGLLLIGYEPFDIPFDNDDPRVESIVSYKNEDKVVVFYLRPEDTVGMKIFDMKRGLTKTTANFPSIGINDVRTILTMY